MNKLEPFTPEWEEAYRKRREEKRTYTYYVLQDPRDMLVHHVGQTKQSLRRRVYGHLFHDKEEEIGYKGSLNLKRVWLDGLLEEGLYPIVKVLDVVEDLTLTEALMIELQYIQAMLDIGMPVLSGETDKLPFTSHYTGKSTEESYNFTSTSIVGVREDVPILDGFVYAFYQRFLGCTLTEVEQEREALTYVRRVYKTSMLA